MATPRVAVNDIGNYVNALCAAATGDVAPDCRIVRPSQTSRQLLPHSTVLRTQDIRSDSYAGTNPSHAMRMPIQKPPITPHFQLTVRKKNLMQVSPPPESTIEIRGSCHKRQNSQAPIRNRQTRKVANPKGLNRNTNLT